MLVHVLDLALWYFGSLEVMASNSTTVLPQREVEGRFAQVDAEDLTLVHLKSTDGVKVFCQADLLTPSYMNYIEIMGTEGSLITSILDYFSTVIFCKQPRGMYQQGNNFFTFPKTNLFERELGYFLQCIQSGQPPELNFMQDSLKLIQLVEEIKEHREMHDSNK
jgi:predicted dehydrogenase